MWGRRKRQQEIADKAISCCLLLLKLKEKGTAILLASHNQEDIRQLCDFVYEMDSGRIQRK